MEITSAIKKLGTLVFNASMEPPRSLKQLKHELTVPETQLKAMKAILSMIQQNYDMGVLYCDVLKITNTTDKDLKLLCNIYLLLTCSDRPACQLMCTQTFIKDFNSGNWQIIKLALIYSVKLSDEIIIKNYVAEIKKMCSHPRKEIKVTAAKCISWVYSKNKNLFFNENFAASLKSLLNDQDDNVVIAALRSIADVEARENIITTSEIIKKLNNFTAKGDPIGMKEALGVLKYKRMTSQMKQILLKLLNNNDIAVFYLAAAKIIENDSQCYQRIYEISKGFFNARPEQLFNILWFVSTFIDKVESRNEDFAILSTDPDYIQDIKILILIKKHDEFAKEEIQRLLKRKVRVMKILECLLRCNVINADVFKYIEPEQTDQTLLIIQRNYRSLIQFHNYSQSISKAWQGIIDEYLNSVKTQMKESQLYIELCGKVCTSIPSLIFKLENEHNALYLLKFYSQMLNRNIIGIKQCKNFLKNLKKSVPHMPLVRLVLDNIENVNAEDICQDLFQISKKNVPEESRIDFPILKNYDDDVLQGRPFEKSNFSGSSDFGMKTRGKVHCSPDQTFEINVSNGKILNEYSKSVEEIASYRAAGNKCRSLTVINTEDLPIFIDTKNFKGTVDIFDDEIVLTVDILDNCQKIQYDFSQTDKFNREDASRSSNKESYELVEEGKYVLQKLANKDINETIRFYIDDMIFECQLNVYKMIRPYKCDENVFEKYFEEAEDMLDLVSFVNENTFKIDETRYTFKVLKNVVYAKYSNDRTILKGKKAIIDYFRELAEDQGLRT